MVKINAYPNFFLIRLLQRDLQETKLWTINNQRSTFRVELALNSGLLHSVTSVWDPASLWNDAMKKKKR